jgi:predicted nucleic acid-binding protein
MDKSFLLDTDILSYAGDDKSPFYIPIIHNLNRLSKRDKIYLSDLSVYEYKAGLYLLDTKERGRILNGFNEIMQYINILPLNPDKGGKVFSEIRAEFQKRTGISNNALKKHTIDMILASEAICNDMIMVYNDNIHQKIAEIRPDFKIAKWTDY